MENATDWFVENCTIFLNNSETVFGENVNCSYNSNWTKNIDSETREKLYNPSIFVVTLLYILYGAICLIALVGNIIVLWLVLGAKKMWTVTNILICNLAFVDVIMAIFIIPFHFQAALFQRWDLPEFLCSICPFVQTWSVTMSSFTLSAIALHRHQGIMRPLRSPISKKMAGMILVLMWAACIIIAFPTGYDYRVIHYWNQKTGTITAYCQNYYLSKTQLIYYTQFVVIVQYFIPLVIITLAYAQMGHKLWRSRPPGNEEAIRDAIMLSKKKKVTKMLVIVVVMFGVCWFPFQMYNFLLTFFPTMNHFPYVNIMWFTFHWLAMSNSCCNPFIYGIYNEKFKREFKNKVGKFSSCMKWVNEEFV